MFLFTSIFNSQYLFPPHFDALEKVCHTDSTVDLRRYDMSLGNVVPSTEADSIGMQSFLVEMK